MDLRSEDVRNVDIQNELESYLLTLPREVRDEILHLVIFSDAHYGNWYASAVPTPKKKNARKRKKAIKIPPIVYPEPDFWTKVHGIDITFFRACRQLRDEGERLLYARITFDFVPNHWWCPTSSAKSFIMGLPPRQRRLVAHLRFDAWTQRHLPSCEWRVLMQLIAKECTNLQTLQITCPNDSTLRLELSRLVEWIRGLSLVRPRSGIVWIGEDGFANDLLDYDDPWVIKMDSLVELAREKDAQPLAPLPTATQFRFLDLPEKARRLVLRHALIPQSGVLHPCLNPNVDDTTANILPVLLSCRAIHREAENVLYREALFSSCAMQTRPQMQQFFTNRGVRQRTLMRRCYCTNLGDGGYHEEIDPWDGELGFKLFHQKSQHPCFPPPILLSKEDDEELFAALY